MKRKLDINKEQYRDLLRLLNEEIYKCAEILGIDLANEEKLIEGCNSIKKINLGKETTELLIDGIMHCDAEDGGKHYNVADPLVLKFIDLEGISFAGRDVRWVDFRGTNADINPQTVKDRNIEGADFTGIDMSDKSFDHCIVCHANLSYTNAIIDPQTVYSKDLQGTICDGLDLSHKDFNGVYIKDASFKDAKINLDPQTVSCRCLFGINLENVDMSGKDFSDCELCYCNLTNTNAVLDLNHLDVDDLYGAKLQGTTLLVGEDFQKEELEKKQVELGEIELNDYTLVKRKIKSIFEKINK